ncbi:hypothetical protein [Tsukamurella tyrosinosolvens]|uniref:hypothetical protein n=1 Tax=Tsukamurella tyrosinosolvens TaxID=57704 RepID=UPI000C7EC9FE|nr:hypothetical protein [Tsukamurella tyrosinosolvens]AUN38631.1 hypothetical protein ASU32_00245 [Tsukamurella tyrosinosolvens]
MSFPMYLKRTSTGSNQRMAAELAPLRAAEAIRAIGTAAEALAALSKSSAPTPEQALSAVLTWRGGQQEIQRLQRELLGCAVLGGGAVSTTAAKLSVRPQTLSSWLAGTVARWRGQEMKHVGNGVWEPLNPSEQQVPSAKAEISPSDDARSMSNAGPSGSGGAAGAGRNPVGAGADAAGAIGITEADRAELARLGIDMREVEREALGGEL